MSKEYVNIVTPMGNAIYPWLTSPDTKFNPEGEYKVSLSVKEKEATPLISKIDSQIKEAIKLAPQGKKVKESEKPYQPELDDDGQETGNIIFKFKMRAQIKTKDGRTIPMSPKLFDASGVLMTECNSIWGGSKIKVSADMIPYYVAAVGAGVSLRLKAVQVIDLVTGGGDDAGSFGFQKEDGYKAPDKSASDQNDFNAEDDQEDF